MVGSKILATNITRLAPADGTPECARCGGPVGHSPRPGGKCEDCRDIHGLESRARTRGLDLATLPDEWFDLLYKSEKTARYQYRERMRAALLDSLVARVFDIAA
jgi:hypothetical protein